MLRQRIAPNRAEGRSPYVRRPAQGERQERGASPDV